MTLPLEPIVTALVNFLWRSRATTATLFPLTAASSLEPTGNYYRKEAVFHHISRVGEGVLPRLPPRRTGLTVFPYPALPCPSPLSYRKREHRAHKVTNPSRLNSACQVVSFASRYGRWLRRRRCR
jgi:hypothetical protein